MSVVDKEEHVNNLVSYLKHVLLSGLPEYGEPNFMLRASRGIIVQKLEHIIDGIYESRDR